jgi:beta-lactamase superfamily II metal-dependent hydrolase
MSASSLFRPPTIFNGIEIDMLSLGDADCLIVTRYVNSQTRRILIDGGSGASFPVILDFLLRRGWTEFSAAVCSHLHNDHAAGLIKLVQNPSLKFQMGFMHDVRNHIPHDALRRAAGADDGFREVWETTKVLGAAFAGRGIPFYEPFAGGFIPDWPEFSVLGPSRDFYKKVLGEATKIDLPIPAPFPAVYSSLGSILGGNNTHSPLFGLAGIAPKPVTSPGLASLLPGALRNSSVQENPKTQAFNNTSTILGVIYNGDRLMFTGDAGSDALDAVPPDWKNLEWMQVPHHGSDGNLSQKNIERFCPKFSYVSARGDSNHPSRAIVNGLLKVRQDAEVFSTHSLNPGHLCYSKGVVPARPEYGMAKPLKATGDQKPIDWASILAGSR